MSREYFERRGAMEPVVGPELLRRVRDGDVTIVDVRPSEEYEAGHVPGAVSIPVSELRARLGELRQDSEIVAYCRGPYCVMAADAVKLLRREGYEAHRMEQGVTEWRARGWRLERGAGR